VKPAVKVESPEMTALGKVDSLKTLAGNSDADEKKWRDCVAAPGMESRIELDEEQAVTMDIRYLARSIAHLPTSLNSEGEGNRDRKSEAPVVATNPGNAGGAKGRRCEITDQGNMARH
jgi:hypothetical protein